MEMTVAYCDNNGREWRSNSGNSRAEI